jgi:oxygen-dependent protoporphyrinogen oxidase
MITDERLRILGQNEAVLDYRINRWPKALPYYGLELERARQELESLSKPGLYLHGNYLSGMGLSKILERSEALAQQIGKNHG